MDELEKVKKELELYKSVLTKAHNKTETELDSLVVDENGEIKDTAFENLLSLDTAKVKKLKTEGQGMFDKGYQKAESEVKTKVEKLFKEKTGFNGDFETTDELFDAYIAESATKQKTKLTDDDVKKHPLYLTLEKERIPKTEYEKLSGEFESYKQQISKKEKMSGVNSYVLNKLGAFNLEQIDDQKVKQKRIENFVREFSDYDYEKDGDSYILLKDDKRVEDEHGNPVMLDKLIESKVSEHFVILQQKPKGGTGNESPKDPNKPQSITIADENDYRQKMNELDQREAKETDKDKILAIKKERIQLGQTWMDQNKS